MRHKPRIEECLIRFHKPEELKEMMEKEGSKSIEEYVSRALAWYEMTVNAQHTGIQFKAHNTDGTIDAITPVKKLFKRGRKPTKTKSSQG
jgi:hypothetical protein